ncbi:hypothetical protein ACNKHO_00940 [Shigella flexneri]
MLIIGGGDGAMLRRLSCHQNVEPSPWWVLNAGWSVILPPDPAQPQCPVAMTICVLTW